jgi:predicted SprT family Zn-dependent metalloprotease
MEREESGDPELMEDVQEEKPKKKKKKGKKKGKKKQHLHRIRCPKCGYTNKIKIDKPDKPRRIEFNCAECGQKLLITEQYFKHMSKEMSLEDVLDSL